MTGRILFTCEDYAMSVEKRSWC